MVHVGFINYNFNGRVQKVRLLNKIDSLSCVV